MYIRYSKCEFEWGSMYSYVHYICVYDTWWWVFDAPPTPVPPQVVFLLSSFLPQGVPSGQPTPSMAFLGVNTILVSSVYVYNHMHSCVYPLCNVAERPIHLYVYYKSNQPLPFHLHSYWPCDSGHDRKKCLWGKLERIAQNLLLEGYKKPKTHWVLVYVKDGGLLIIIIMIQYRLDAARKWVV